MSHNNPNILTKIIAGSTAGVILVAVAFLCVSVCTIKHCIHQQRNRISEEADQQVAECIYDTIDPAYTVIGQARKETKITVNDAYNFELH